MVADLRVQVGSMVRHHRERVGMTQAQLAEGIDKSVQLVGRIERGTAAPSFETLGQLAMALNVDVRQLFGSGEFAAGRDGPLAALVNLVAALDQSDLEWLRQLVEVALSRKPPRRVASTGPDASDL